MVKLVRTDVMAIVAKVSQLLINAEEHARMSFAHNPTPFGIFKDLRRNTEVKK
jgi:hypothetical protein